MFSKYDSELRDLHARLEKLENGNAVLPAKETIHGRMDREREERAQKTRDAQAFKPHQSLMGAARPTNDKRWQEVKDRHKSLPSPAQPQKPSPKPPAESSVKIEFTTWKEGKVCLVQIKAESAPVPIKD